MFVCLPNYEMALATSASHVAPIKFGGDDDDDHDDDEAALTNSTVNDNSDGSSLR